METHPQTTGRIPKRMLPFLRVSWILISFTAITVTVIGMVDQNYTFHLPCESQVVYETCLARQDALDQLGLSFPFLANYFSVGVAFELFPWFFAGMLIFWRMSDRWFGFLLSLSMMLAGLSTIDTAMVTWAKHAIPALEHVTDSIEFLGVSLLVVWFLFPNGRLPFRWLIVLIGFWIIRNIASWYFPNSIISTSRLPWWVDWGINYLFGVILSLALIYRYRFKSNRIEQQQIKWVVTTIVMMVGIYIFQRNLYQRLETERALMIGYLTVTPIYYLASGLVPISITIAVFKYRLFDIDVIIRRTLQYTLLSGLLVLLYFSGVLLGQSIVEPFFPDKSSPLIIVFTTLGIAAIFNPLRARVQDFIDRRFFRRKYDAEKALNEFASISRNQVDVRRLSNTLLAVVEQTMQPEHTSLWLRETAIIARREPNRT